MLALHSRSMRSKRSWKEKRHRKRLSTSPWHLEKPNAKNRLDADCATCSWPRGQNVLIRISGWISYISLFAIWTKALLSMMEKSVDGGRNIFGPRKPHDIDHARLFAGVWRLALQDSRTHATALLIDTQFMDSPRGCSSLALDWRRHVRKCAVYTFYGMF